MLNEAGVSELFKANLWRLVGDDEGAVVPKGVIVREMTEFPREDLDAAMKFGLKYVDDTNYLTNAPQTFIADPKLDGRNVRSGTWHLIKQTIEISQQTGDLALRQYLRLDIAGMRTVFPSLQSTLEDDKTMLYNRSINTIEAPEQPRGSLYRASNSFNEDDSTYDGNLVYALGKPETVQWAQRRTAFSATDEVLYRNAASKVEAPAVTGSGVYQANNQINEFGLYDSSLIYTRGTGGGQVAHSSRRSTLEDEDRILYRASNTKIDAPDSAHGYLYDATNNLNDDGTYDATLQYSKGNPETVGFRSARTAFSETDQVLYRNASSKVEAPAITGSGQYQATNQINQFGLYDSTLLYTHGTGGGWAAHSSKRSELEDEDRVIYKNSETKIDAPDSAAGYLYDATNTINDDGTYNATLQYSKGNPATVEFLSRKTPRLDQSQIVYQNKSSKVDAPADAQGYQYEAGNRVNQFGLFDATLIYNAAQEQNLYQITEIMPANEGLESRTIYRNETTLPAAVQNVPNHIYTQAFNRNEFDLYDGEHVHKITTSNTFGAVVSSRSEQTDAYTYMYENQLAMIDVPATEEGTSGWARNVKDGTFNGNVNIRKERTVFTWWGGTGEYAFHYKTTISEYQYDVYIYDKYTRTLTSGEKHLNEVASVAGAIIIGANDGHIMDLVPIGQGRLRARRIELL